MTKEEILAMKAGRDLDALVLRTFWWDLVKHDVEGATKFLMEWCKFQPSADIAQTWEVLKKLKEEYWCIEIKIADGCWVILELLRTPPIRVEVNAGTPFEKLPEAICKAALLAKLRVD